MFLPRESALQSGCHRRFVFSDDIRSMVCSSAIEEHTVAEKVLVFKVHFYKLSPIIHSSWRSVTKNGSQVEYYVASETNRSHERYRPQPPTAMTKEWEGKEFLDQWRFQNRLLLFANLAILNFHTLPSIPFSHHTYFGPIFKALSARKTLWPYINKSQRDAAVCRCLFTAKLLYMFRVSIAPIIRSKSNCNCSFWYRS